MLSKPFKPPLLKTTPLSSTAVSQVDTTAEPPLKRRRISENETDRENHRSSTSQVKAGNARPKLTAREPLVIVENLPRLETSGKSSINPNNEAYYMVLW